MKRPYEAPIQVVTLEVRMDDLEPVLDTLRGHWDTEPVQIARPHHDVVWLELYFTDELEARIAGALHGADPRVRSVQIRRTDGQDWQAAFQAQFTMKEIGRRLRICPVWDRAVAPADDRITLWVDPGLSFGTGEHFTTAFCLEMLDRLWLDSAPDSLLDVGTGSGLLAIAAVRLGCARVVAIENDAGVLAYTRENFVRNQVADAVDLRHGDLRTDRLPGRFEVVCANLVSGLLMECAGKLIRVTGRWLVITGIREVEADGVAAVYTGQGAREVVRDGDGEWVGMLFECGRPIDDA